MPLHGAEQSQCPPRGPELSWLLFAGSNYALLLLFKLSITDYGDYQFSTPPFLYQKTFKKPANYLLHKIMAELLQELVIVLQRRDLEVRGPNTECESVR